jgi:hypothetical protein
MLMQIDSLKHEGQRLRRIYLIAAHNHRHRWQAGNAL